MGFFIGYRYTLPVLGMVNRNRDCLYQVVETWWDCSVAVEHLPGERSTLDFNWLPSLGRLGYPRRSLMRFADANGVKADFDLAKGLCRVQGVSGFSGEWEKPHRGEL